MLWYFHGHPKKLYHYGELLAELKKRSHPRNLIADGDSFNP